MNRRHLFASIAGMIFFPAQLLAQIISSKQIRIINPFPPGGTTDILSRIISSGLQVAGQASIVESHPGAGGNLGLQIAAKADPDGNTIAVIPIAAAISSSLYRNLGFKLTTDFRGIAFLGNMPSLLLVTKDSRFTSIEQVVDYGKKNPGKLTYASFGTGTSPQLFMELFLNRYGITAIHVPYKGAAPALTDLLGGQVDIGFQTATSVLGLVQQGKLRPLAVSTKERFEPLPLVPTIAETGLPGFDAGVWFGVVAPAKTPTATVNKLNAEINKILTSPDNQKKLKELGVSYKPMTADEFNTFVKSEESKWAQVAKLVGIEPE